MRWFLLWAGIAAAGPQTPLGLDAYLPVPPDNPIAAETAALGRALFFDARLSRDGSVSCATCHEPKRAFTDTRPLATGIGAQVGTRRTPALVNRGYGRAFFWDGRAGTLEDQVLKPIENPIEMDLPLAEAALRTGHEPAVMAKALATYVRTIRTGGSRYDRFLAGDREALDEREQLGLRLFRGKAQCASCHLGPNLTDERFHNTGIGFRDGRFADPGRASVTGAAGDTGAFKTPTLRNAAERAPYMHDGSLATLEDVIEHYDKGGIENPHLDTEMRPLQLTADEKAALVALLQAMTGPVEAGWPPERIE